MIKISSVVSLSLFLGFSYINSGWAAVCDIHSVAKDRCTANIEDLHPTQFSVGMIEVKEKSAHIETLKRENDTALSIFQNANPEPTVIGPGGKLYIIDHHHLALAMWLQDVQTTDCVIEANYSNLDIETFWQTMQTNKWVYLEDQDGKPQSIANLPVQVQGLKDDPYRSLAGAVEGQGFSKTTEPFAEFLWADYFRHDAKDRFPLSLLQGNFEKATKKGIEAAKEPEAKNLPGYDGPGTSTD